MRTKFTRSSRRHKIGRAHVLHVMNAVTPAVVVNALGETEYSWVGLDDRGVELQIAAVVIEAANRSDADTDEDLMLVVHVMPTYR
jgi:hypothetical protein